MLDACRRLLTGSVSHSVSRVILCHFSILLHGIAIASFVRLISGLLAGGSPGFCSVLCWFLYLFFTSVFDDRASFCAERVAPAQVKSQFYRSFCASTLISCERHHPRPKERKIKKARERKMIFFSVQRQMALARSFIQPERQLHFANSPN